MFYLLLIFGALFGSFQYLSAKYNNPNKLIFIFGKKGSGKSTYMVYLMLQYLKKGWNVYTNMSDVVIPGVRLFTIEQLKTCAPDPHSVLFVDEGGLIWDNRGFKSFDKGYTEFFKLQRKYKCKVYINSQDFDIDKKIRQLTDSMVLMNCIAGCIGVVRPIIRKVALVEASAQGESRVADNLRFGGLFSYRFLWLPKYFKYFDSYKAPERPQIDFKSVEGDVIALHPECSLTPLKNAFRRADKKQKKQP